MSRKKEIQQIKNNKDLLELFALYDGWCDEQKRGRWMVVLTVAGTPYQFLAANKDAAEIILNDLAERVDRRFLKRLFLGSRGDLYSVDFYRVARSSHGSEVIRKVC